MEKGSWLSRSTGGQYGKRTTLTCSGGGPGKIPCILYGLLKLLETCIVCSKLLESFKSLAHKSNHFSGLLPIPSQPSFPLAHRFDWPTLQCRIMVEILIIKLRMWIIDNGYEITQTVAHLLSRWAQVLGIKVNWNGSGNDCMLFTTTVELLLLKVLLPEVCLSPHSLWGKNETTVGIISKYYFFKTNYIKTK